MADEAFQLTSATTGEEMERTERKRNGRRRGGECRCRPVVSWMAVSGDVTSVEIVDEIGFSAAAAATTAAVSSARRGSSPRVATDDRKPRSTPGGRRGARVLDCFELTVVEMKHYAYSHSGLFNEQFRTERAVQNGFVQF